MFAKTMHVRGHAAEHTNSKAHKTNERTPTASWGESAILL
jgi:hypothetical protein